MAVRRLRDVLRDDDRLGRIGGDEFLVLCPQVTDRLAASIGDRLARALSGCVALSGVTVPLQASVGVAWSAAPLHDAARLIHEADEAMYASKRRATGSAVVYGEGVERPS